MPDRTMTPAEYMALAELATVAIRSGFNVNMIAVGQLLVTLPTAAEGSTSC